jgi:hypothetical protein
MPTFVLAYRSAKGYVPSPETGQAWRSWFEGMGDSLVDLGKPVIDRTALGNHDAESTQLGGYSLVTADDLEAAVAIAKGCPALSSGGGVEVGELGDVPAPASGMSAG